MSDTKSLIVENISKTWQKRKVLNSISLKVNPGEILSIVGPSGAGKTTLLRIIAGLEKADGGSIQLGTTTTKTPIHERNMAMLFQEGALFPHLTVAANLAFPLKKLKKEAVQAQIQKIANLLQLEPLLTRYPEHLSGGEKQRVAIARVIIRNPQALLLDEPFSHLDFPLQYSLRKLMREIKKQALFPIVYVTHDQQEAIALGDQMGVLIEGKLQQLAPPKEVYLQPANMEIAKFIGNPPFNFIEGEIIDGFFCCSSLSPLKIEGKNGHAILAIRPEFVQIEEKDIEGDILAFIEAIEFIGPDTVLYLQIKTISLRSRLFTVAISLKVGETVKVRLLLEKAIVFYKNPPVAS